MDELAVAAAVEAMSVDDATKENQAPDVTVGTVDAAEALQAIDGNTGKPKRPDSPSNLPPPVRGARCLHDFCNSFKVCGRLQRPLKHLSCGRSVGVVLRILVPPGRHPSCGGLGHAFAKTTPQRWALLR